MPSITCPRLFIASLVLPLLVLAKEPASDHGPKPEAGKSERRTPKPDTAFATAATWDDGQSEILAYTVTRSSPDTEFRCDGHLATERLYLNADGLVARKRGGKSDQEILNAALTLAWKEDGVPRSVETVVEMSRRAPFSLLRQEQSMQSWPSVTYRSLDCRVTPPRMRALSSGGEAAVDRPLEKWPVYTEEMLFTYLRALPQRAGYREEVWMLDAGVEGRLSTKVQYAAITVRSQAAGIRDMDTWYVTIDRDDGRRSEFWVALAGLHPVVMAILVDRSVWTLQGIDRRKYHTW